eukprot:7100327-Pyramimonas_sp.AAC.1
MGQPSVNRLVNRRQVRGHPARGRGCQRSTVTARQRSTVSSHRCHRREQRPLVIERTLLLIIYYNIITL